LLPMIINCLFSCIIIINNATIIDLLLLRGAIL